MPVGADLAKAAVKELSEAAEPYVRSIGHQLSRTPEGQDAAMFLTRYRQKTDQIFTALHTKAQGELAAGSITAMPQSHELLGNARTAARTAVFDKNDKKLVYLIHNSHVNQGHVATQNLMDNIAMYLHEDTKIGTHEHESMLKTRAAQHIHSTDPTFKQAAAIAKEEKIPLSEAQKRLGIENYTTSSDYRHPGDKERKVFNFIYNRFSPLIAIPHLGTILNTVQSTQMSSIVKALADFGSEKSLVDMKRMQQASGITAESALRGMRAVEDVRNGSLTKHLPGSFQDVLTKVTTTPGFNYIRDWQINFTGAATYHSAIDHAATFAKDGEGARYARARLEQYGMHAGDLAKIKTTGTLTQDQLERAVWNGVNKKIFLDSSLNRAPMAQKDFFHRAFTMYHGYVSSQAKFMGDELKLAFKEGNVAQIAKTVGVLGVLFPAAGEALKMLEMVGRGQWNQIAPEAHHDFEAVSAAKDEGVAAHARDFAGVYIDALAHLGGFGVGFELIQGIQRGFLMQQMAGPLLGTGVKYTQDFGGLGFKAIEGKPLHPEAVERDLLEIALPYGLGRYAKHALVPTKKEQEQAKGGSHKLKRMKIGGGLKHMTVQ